ncbi:hypothetical protein L1987_48611 [Smallanthus sonchifolius]|uniref:Uncharacterized protein n=1 Tax=Smallanthus sonchifolius TaxID=185202 RepID=A0ACB9FRT0_9ASTR|nr:hypothetical protein L1987_48611 [Smallanthus sonchifolius]
MLGIPVGGVPPRSWERDYLTVERVRQLHDQGFDHEMRLHHHQNLMEQMAGQLSATHLELHRARDLIEDAMREIRNLRIMILVWGLVACVLFVLLLYGLIFRLIRRRVRLCGSPTTLPESSVRDRTRAGKDYRSEPTRPSP